MCFVVTYLNVWYYATGTKLTLVVISAPLRSGGNPIVHDIVSADLKFKQDQIKSICRLINLFGFLKILPNLVLGSGIRTIRERVLHRRDCCFGCN